MNARPLEATVRFQPEIAIVDLSGEINAAGDHTLSAAYAEATSRGARSVLLNFADVGYINSTGIALIVGLLAQARKTGRRLLVCGLSDHYLEIFRVTRLSDFMSVYPDEASATRASA